MMFTIRALRVLVGDRFDVRCDRRVGATTLVQRRAELHASCPPLPFDVFRVGGRGSQLRIEARYFGVNGLELSARLFLERRQFAGELLGRGRAEGEIVGQCRRHRHIGAAGWLAALLRTQRRDLLIDRRFLLVDGLTPLREPRLLGTATVEAGVPLLLQRVRGRRHVASPSRELADLLAHGLVCVEVERALRRLFPQLAETRGARRIVRGELPLQRSPFPSAFEFVDAVLKQLSHVPTPRR